MRRILLALALALPNLAHADQAITYPVTLIPLSSGDAAMLAYLTGALRPQTSDNANDIGTAANRWRTGRFGTSAIIGTGALNLTLAQSLFSSTGQDLIFSSSTGLLRPNNDNLQDLGTAANRWRTGRFGTSVVVGASTTLTDGMLATSASDFIMAPSTNIFKGSANGVLQLGTAANAMSQLFLTTQLSVANNAVTTTGFGSTTGSTTVSSAGGADVILFPNSNSVVPQNDNTTALGTAAKRFATGQYGVSVTDPLLNLPASAGDPGATAAQAKLYSKTVTGVTQLFSQASDGTVTTLSPATLGNTVTTASGTITTTSGADVLVTSMTVTPAAGTYLVFFVSNVTQTGTGAGLYAALSIYAGGVQVSGTEIRDADSTNFNTPFTCVGVTTVTGAQAIEGRWRRSAAGVGTITMDGVRTLTIVRIG